MNGWKSAAISAVATIVVAAFSFAGGYWVLQQTIEEKLTEHRELDIKMVDVALAILAGEKGSKPENQSVEARRFAVQILRQYSKIDDPEDNEKPVDWDGWAESVDKPLQLETVADPWGTDEVLQKLYSDAFGGNLSKSVKDCLKFTRNSYHCYSVYGPASNLDALGVYRPSPSSENNEKTEE